MKTPVRTLLVLVHLALLSSSGAIAQTYDFSRLDKLLQDSLAVIGGTGTDDFGGLTLLVWRDDKLVYEKSLALPGKNMSRTRLMPVASASKWMSGTVITSMLERGLLRLDDSVAQYIPTAKGAARAATFRQLFSFTAGFKGNLTGPTGCVEDLNSKASLAQCVDEILALPMPFKPGEVMNYGSDGMQVGGRMAEIASGEKIASGSCWDTLFKRFVAEPLGLKRTGWDIPPIYYTDNPRIDGGVWSNADEYLILTRMILNRGIFEGKRILGEAAIDSMLADQTRGARIVFSPYMQYDSIVPGIDETRYGIGVWRERLDRVTGELRECASQGKFGFSPWVDFERKYCAVLAVKSDLTTIYPSYTRIKQTLRAIFDAPTSVQEQEFDTDEWRPLGWFDVLGRRVTDEEARGCVIQLLTNGRDYRSRLVVR
ncbi:MAG: serine hydrolase domain-containing protein [Candidatus Kapaibacterium sp.]